MCVCNWYVHHAMAYMATYYIVLAIRVGVLSVAKSQWHDHFLRCWNESGFFSYEIARKMYFYVCPVCALHTRNRFYFEECPDCTQNTVLSSLTERWFPAQILHSSNLWARPLQRYCRAKHFFGIRRTKVFNPKTTERNLKIYRESAEMKEAVETWNCFFDENHSLEIYSCKVLQQSVWHVLLAGSKETKTGNSSSFHAK